MRFHAVGGSSSLASSAGLAAFLSATFLVWACGGERSAGGSADSTLSLASPGANPIAVSVKTDGSATTSQTVGEAGGVLTATGADGIRFTLTIPPKALVAEETITLTPVTAVGDLPLTGGLVAAAHLEPEGLRLLEPATLKVTAARDTNTNDLSGFGYHAMGEEFHLSPYEVDGKTLTARLFHFSGFGWAMTAIGNILKIHHHVPTSPEDRAAQRMSKVAQEARRTGKMDPAAVEAIFRDWYAEEIRPALEQAVTNDAIAVLAGGKFVAWMRQVALLGLDGELGAEIRAGTALFWKAARNAFDKAAERCVKDKDPAHPRQMVAIARMFALFGSDELANELDAKLARCAGRPTLRFTYRHGADFRNCQETPTGDRAEVVQETLEGTLDLPAEGENVRGRMRRTLLRIGCHADDGWGGVCTMKVVATVQADVEITYEEGEDRGDTDPQPLIRVAFASDEEQLPLSSFGTCRGSAKIDPSVKLALMAEWADESRWGVITFRPPKGAGPHRIRSTAADAPEGYEDWLIEIY